MWSVYILLCEDGSLYTGITNNLEKRFAEHSKGKGGRYTRSHKVVKLIYHEEIGEHSKALKRELEIKGWRREEKIKQLNLNF